MLVSFPLTCSTAGAVGGRPAGGSVVRPPGHSVGANPPTCQEIFSKTTLPGKQLLPQNRPLGLFSPSVHLIFLADDLYCNSAPKLLLPGSGHVSVHGALGVLSLDSHSGLPLNSLRRDARTLCSVYMKYSPSQGENSLRK